VWFAWVWEPLPDSFIGLLDRQQRHEEAGLRAGRGRQSSAKASGA